MKINHTTNNDHHKLSDILDDLCLDRSEQNISLATILYSLNNRGYAPLLIIPCLLIISPVGAIPGVPAICGVFIFLIAGQMLLGRKKPWLPERVKKLCFETEKFCSGMEKTEPFLRKLDKIIKPRITFMATNRAANFFVSFISVILSIGIVGIGFIPFLPDLLALPILFFSLGLLTQDGFIVALGYFALIGALIALPLIF